MALRRNILALSIVTGIHCLYSAPAHASGEEDKAKKAKKEAQAPEDTEAPQEPETIDPSLSEAEAPSPTFEEPSTAVPAVRKRNIYLEEDLDRNVDYSKLLDTVEVADTGRGVLAPGLGFRGYRPSMIAAGGGDRVPGFGAMVEYSWNRIGIGAFACYRNTKGEDYKTSAYGMTGLYGLYRWLPWDISPYFLLGIEVGNETIEPFGGLTGVGVEARIYSGWTILVGWTHHSTVRRGFLGGALGWSF